MHCVCLAARLYSCFVLSVVLLLVVKEAAMTRVAAYFGSRPLHDFFDDSFFGSQDSYCVFDV